MKKITPQNFKENIADATKSLLKLARLESWNTIPDNVLYTIRFFNSNVDEVSGWGRYSILKKVRLASPIIELDQAIEELLPIFEDIYDLNLFIAKSLKNRTIVEIFIFKKSNLDKEYRKIIENDQPMFHSKVPIPPYAHDFDGKNKKFNINWELNPIDHRIKLFFWKLRMKWKFKNL